MCMFLSNLRLKQLLDEFIGHESLINLGGDLITIKRMNSLLGQKARPVHRYCADYSFSPGQSFKVLFNTEA